MKIGRMNERITFQKNEIVSDQYKNRVPVWSDYFSCWAYNYCIGEQAELHGVFEGTVSILSSHHSKKFKSPVGYDGNVPL